MIEAETLLILVPAVPVRYVPGVIGPGYPTLVPGADLALLALAISICHTMKQVLEPCSLRTPLGRAYKGPNWQVGRQNNEFKFIELEPLIKDFIAILGWGPLKPCFVDLALTHLLLPISRKSCKNHKLEDVLNVEISHLGTHDIIDWLSAPLIIKEKADINIAEPGMSYFTENALGSKFKYRQSGRQGCQGRRGVWTFHTCSHKWQSGG
jgi:hypothetical protein